MRAVNLLPPDLRSGAKASAPAVASGEKTSGAGAFVVLGVLAFCVLALAAYVLAGNTVKDRQAELARATAESNAESRKAEALKPYADFETLVNARVQTVKDLAGSRFDWEQTLRDISRAIPSDVTLTSLTGSVASGAAVGGSTVRGAIPAPAVELKGCTPTQKTVATLLSRLRSVDGVTRVSLSKSLKPSMTPTATVATSPDVNLCPGKRPPSFELVVFFERSKVPASVQDITLQTAAPSGQQSGAAGGSTATPASATGVTTPPADPAATPTATPTPQAGAR